MDGQGGGTQNKEVKWREGKKRGLREEIQGETDKAKSHLKGHMETYYSKSILKYMYL